MFGAVNLRRLTQHRRAALCHQQVRGIPHRRVRRDTGAGVASAALQCHYQLGGVDCLPSAGVRGRQQPPDRLDSRLHRLDQAALLLDDKGRRVCQSLACHQVGYLIDFAAQTNEDVAGDVGLAGKASQRALQQVDLGAALVGAAAALVGEGNDAIDVGEVAQRVTPETIGHVARDAGAAVDRRDDGDVVARSRPTIGSAKALEGPTLRRRHQLHRMDVPAVGVVVGERTDREVVGVDVLPRRDGGGGEADDLAVAVDRLAGRNRSQGNLMPGRDHLSHPHGLPWLLQPEPGSQRDLGNRDLVFRMETDGYVVERCVAGSGGGELNWLQHRHNSSFRCILPQRVGLR